MFHAVITEVIDAFQCILQEGQDEERYIGEKELNWRQDTHFKKSWNAVCYSPF